MKDKLRKTPFKYNLTTSVTNNLHLLHMFKTELFYKHLNPFWIINPAVKETERPRRGLANQMNCVHAPLRYLGYFSYFRFKGFNWRYRHFVPKGINPGRLSSSKEHYNAALFLWRITRKLALRKLNVYFTGKWKLHQFFFL